MSRILGWAGFIVGAPQVAFWGFWLIGRSLGLDSENFRMGFLTINIVAFVISAIVASVVASEMWPDYRREAKALRERAETERQRLMAAIDEQIGIPRIPRGRP